MYKNMNLNDKCICLDSMSIIAPYHMASMLLSLVLLLFSARFGQIKQWLLQGSESHTGDTKLLMPDH